MDQIKLLLVDDEDEFREATGKALGRRNFAVTTAESGERALELLREARPEIVVLDLRMGGIDGIETLKRLRQEHAELPVVILTGHGGFDEAVAGIKLQIVDFLQKPVSVAFLAARVRALLARGSRGPLKERTIAELMIPAAAYRRFYADQPLREVLGPLRDELFKGSAGKVTEQGRRTVLVYERGSEEFVGCLRLGEILEMVLPSFLRDSPYASFFTGMLVAQSKVVGSALVGDYARREPSVELEAPLMEALNRIVTSRVINLPVLRNGGELVGVLRDKDLLLEICGHVLGEER
jgi:CheY-like chemotaxis protein